MRNLLTICVSVSLSLSLTACNSLAPAAPGTLMPTGQAGMSRRAQPTGSLKGKLVLPYRIETSSRVARGGFDLLAYVVGQPAQAQEASPTNEPDAGTAATEANTDTTATGTDATDAGTSGPLSEAEVENLTATVDGQPVELDVTDIEASTTGDETVVNYEIDEAPVGDGMEVVEITTTSGEAVGGAVVEVPAGTTTEQDITPETTAVLETCVQTYGSLKIADLSQEDLIRLALDPTILRMQASLRSLLRRDGAFKHNAERKFKWKG
ncbi:MAG: hypothetical protein ACAI44_25425, partial [Candidatus Sericytochromatia bacterium]